MTQQPQPKGRIDAIDIARGVALVAMAIYHLTWDLEFFGYVPPGMTAVGGWKLFARSIASSFLFLVGVGLFLGHSKGIRWRGYLRRLAMVAAAALAITVATYFAMRDGFIFFGILHQIVLASLLGLLFLRLPAIVTLIAAAAVIAAPQYLQSDFFNDPWWWWTGLSESRPRSNDYVPLLPWFGAVLTGIAAAKIAAQAGFFAWLATLSTPTWTRPLTFFGKHSLAFYLIHQPVLIACVWLFSQVFPPPPVPREVRLEQCEVDCSGLRDKTFCARYCACMLDTLEQEGALESAFARDVSQALRSRVKDIAGFCTAEADGTMLEGGGQ